MVNQGSKVTGRSKGCQNPVAVGVVLLAAGVSVAMMQYKVPTIMGELMAMFSMNPASASWLMSMFTLASIVVAIPAGMLVQRLGAKMMMIVALGVAVTGSLVGIASDTSALLIISRAIEGAALTMVTTCGPVLVQACVKSGKIGLSMGIWGMWGCLGSTIAAVVGPTVFASMGLSGLWALFALCAIVACVLVLVTIRVPVTCFVSSGIRETRAQNIPEVSGSVPRPRYRTMLTRDIVLFFGGFVVFNLCLLAVLAFVPTILQMRGVDPTLSGLISTAPMLLSIVSSPLFGAISDRIGHRKPLLVTAMVVMGPCTFLLYTNTGVLLGIAVVVMGFVGMGGIGMFLSGYVKLLPHPGLVSIGMGVLVLVQGVGQFLGTFFVQMLLGPELTNVMLAGGVLMVLGFVGTASLLACRMR